jgi:hypothetical protein
MRVETQGGEGDATRGVTNLHSTSQDWRIVSFSTLVRLLTKVGRGRQANGSRIWSVPRDPLSTRAKDRIRHAMPQVRVLVGEGDAERGGPACDHLAVVLAGAQHVTTGKSFNRLLDQLTRLIEHQLLWVK